MSCFPRACPHMGDGGKDELASIIVPSSGGQNVLNPSQMKSIKVETAKLSFNISFPFHGPSSGTVLPVWVTAVVILNYLIGRLKKNK